MRLPVLGLAAAIALVFFSRTIAGWLGAPEGSSGSEIARQVCESLVLIATAWVVMRLLHSLVWTGVVLRRTGAAAPRLLTDLVNGLIVVTVGALIIAFVLDRPVTGLIATSGIAVAVIGFALKSMISDLFSGIAITLERPFSIGSWIEITGGTVGKVQSMTWRTTGLQLLSGIYVVVPNSRLSEMVLRVYDRPEPMWRDEIDITFGYDVRVDQVERILLAAAADVPEIAALGKKAAVIVVEFGDNGVKWRLLYWVPDFPSRGPLRLAVQRNILHNLHFAGVSTAAPRVHAQIAQVDPLAVSAQSVHAFLGRISLFKPLSAEEMGELVANADSRLIKAGTQVVKAGEEGNSLFVIQEGLFSVAIPGNDGKEKVVARLKPGAFFGEMSLLTGAPRSAAVTALADSTVIEITKDAIEPILLRREKLMEAMSEALAERQLQNDRALQEKASVEEKQTAQHSLARQLLGRMRSFFFGRGAAESAIEATSASRGVAAS
jgi:small-conductance mechanosensitive channel/CRP-like cAMP-binding protein